MDSSSYQTLLEQLAAVEERLQNPTLSHLDRQLLTLAWEDISSQLDEMETIEEPPVEEEWQDAREALDSPPPPSPIRFAPSPPPIVFQPGDHVPPPPVDRTVSSHGVPPLSATRQSVPNPADWQPMEAPPPPGWWEPDEEEIERANNSVDDRLGCARCPGCHYCTGYGYDGSDEV
jgi:hypothetical protein